MSIVSAKFIREEPTGVFIYADQHCLSSKFTCLEEYGQYIWYDTENKHWKGIIKPQLKLHLEIVHHYAPDKSNTHQLDLEPITMRFGSSQAQIFMIPENLYHDLQLGVPDHYDETRDSTDRYLVTGHFTFVTEDVTNCFHRVAYIESTIPSVSPDKTSHELWVQNNQQDVTFILDYLPTPLSPLVTLKTFYQQ